MSTTVVYKLLKEEDIPDAIAIEEQGFPPEEAGSLGAFQFRQKNAPELFLGAFVEQNVPSSDGPNPLATKKLIGYVVSTLAAGNVLTHSSMSKHVPVDEGGESICMHSICVHPEWRKKGLASQLLQEYIRRAQELSEESQGAIKRILLIAHEELVSFYQKAGFTLRGKSDIVHGPREWFELAYEFRSSSSPEMSLDMQANVMAALAKRTPAPLDPKAKRAFADFHSSTELVDSDPASGSQTNAYRIVCPRRGCNSLILSKGATKMVEAASVQIDSKDDPPPESILPPLPPPPGTTTWWLVVPNPFVFENIGYSKTISTPDQKIKLLSCAECDLGPLGWSTLDGKESWIAISRVAYRS